jgi:hypothetical protein
MHLFLNLNTICVLIIDFLRIQVFPFPIQDGIPAFTVPQPDEAMNVLVDKASKLNVSCIFPSEFYFSLYWKMLASYVGSKLWRLTGVLETHLKPSLA